MRNFKKFLALVLAMLMVSAGAVSAAYTDQAAINATGYANAVSLISDLGVMQGPGDGSFNANGTLTRAEAAVIAAKLNTGAAGRKIDWTSSTCSFADVTAAWSFAYINYASQNGIMDGIGDGKFNPNGTLSIAEAIVLAVKIIEGGREAVYEMNKYSTPAYWATNWIAVANDKHITDNLVVFDYTQPCSRAMMAQIAFNVFNQDADIKTAFEMEKVEATISAVGSDKVTLTTATETLTVDRAAFEKAMTATGATGTAEDIKGAKVTMTYTKDNGTVYGVTLNSGTLAFDYTDAKLVRVVENNANTKYITLDGQKYVVADTDETNNTVIGATSVIKAITINKHFSQEDWIPLYEDVIGEDGEPEKNEDGSNKTVFVGYDKEVKLGTTESIPSYYDAIAYDDNADGYYDRIELNLYHAGTLKAGTADARTISGVAYTFDTVYDLNGKAVFTNYSAADAEVDAIVYTGEEFTFGEVPVLYHVAYNAGTDNWDIDILEVAKTVTGTLTTISNKNKNVTIDGTAYKFAAENVAPESWTLSQTVSIYTIGDQYVKFTGASITPKTVIVNNVVVKDGNAIVTGYDVGNNYADITLTVVGTYDATNGVGKLLDKTAHEIPNEKNTDTKKYAGEIAIGTYKSSTATWTDDVQFVEGGYYNFVVTTDGVYAAAADAVKNLQTQAPLTAYGTLEVKGGYIYNDGSAVDYTDDKVVILELVNAADDNYNAYADSYNKYTAYNKRANAKAYTLDTDNNKKINLVYVGNATDLASEAYALDAGQTIVQIISGAIDEGLKSSTYEAFDLLTGNKVVIESTINAYKGNFYVVKDGKLVRGTTNKWVRDNDINVVYDGIVGTVKADTTMLSTLNGVTTAETGKKDVKFGIDQITIYKADANGIIVDGDNNGAADTLKLTDELLKARTAAEAEAQPDLTVKYNYVSYIVEGKMIVIIEK